MRVHNILVLVGCATVWIEVEVIIVRDQAHIGVFADYEADYADDCGSGHADFRGIEFTKVVQMFYPFSLQTHPHSFPGKATYVRIPQLKRRRKDTHKTLVDATIIQKTAWNFEHQL